MSDPPPDDQETETSEQPAPGTGERGSTAGSSPEIEGQILLIAAAKASVSPTRLPELVGRVSDALAVDRDRYRDAFECIREDDERAVYLVPEGHWVELGTEVGLDRREWRAVRRAHNEQFRRIGRRTGRREEFETALEIRDAVVVARR